MLKKIGTEGYVKGQEQAKIYYKTVPKGEFRVEINKIAEMVEISRILGVANDEKSALDIKEISIVTNEGVLEYMCIYYMVQNLYCKHISVVNNCEAESDRQTGEKIMAYIRKSMRNK